MSCLTKTSEAGLISGGISWIPQVDGGHIGNVIQTCEGCDLQQVDTAVLKQHLPLQVEQQGDVPCTITLQCAATDTRCVITSLLVVSEARTIEVYSASGDYCGTCRGAEDPSVRYEGATDSGRPFYKTYLKLQCPTTSCEVKLLSLGGRASVGIAAIYVGVEQAQGSSKDAEKDSVESLSGVGGTSIDLKQVQSMVEEMGATLSPGAQHLMDMVQFQQKSRTDTMAGFLPLLMGCGGGNSGLLSALATNKGSSVLSSGSSAGHHPPPSPSLSAGVHHAPALSSPCTTTTTTTPPPTPVPLPGCSGPIQPNSNNSSKLSEMMSTLMMHASAPPGQHCAASASPLSPDLLPLLQSVCCQVARLRMDDATTAAMATAATAMAAQGKGGHAPNGPAEVHPCCRGLEEALGRRLQDIEDRLKEHVDQRFSSLEQKLDAVLQLVQKNLTTSDT